MMGDAGSSQPADERIEAIRQALKMLSVSAPATCEAALAALAAVAAELAELRQALQAADALADRWEAIDGKADDFGRAWELVRYREARAALSRGATPVNADQRIKALDGNYAWICETCGQLTPRGQECDSDYHIGLRWDVSRQALRSDVVAGERTDARGAAP